MEPTDAMIRALFSKVAERIDQEQQADVIDWLDHREWELALDVLDDFLFDADAYLTESEQEEMAAIVDRMGLSREHFAMLRAERRSEGA